MVVYMFVNVLELHVNSGVAIFADSWGGDGEPDYEEPQKNIFKLGEHAVKKRQKIIMTLSFFLQSITLTHITALIM